MPRIGLCILVLSLILIGCSAPPLPEATRVSRADALVSTVESPPDAANAVLASATATLAPSTTLAATSTALPSRSPTSSPSPLANSSATPSRSATAGATLTVTVTPTATKTVPAFPTFTRTPTASPTLTATVGVSVTQVPTRQPTLRPRPTEAPKGSAVLTPFVSGQRVTAMYVGPDGSIYYGVAPNDESLQTPLQPVFQLWKLPPGGAPMPITPATMRLIGGVLVHNGTIYFSEAGALRRMPDNRGVQEGQVVIHFPTIAGNVNLPYGHMNHALATYNLNGQEVLLMAVGSLLDSSFPAAGVPANISEPYYEDFPTGRIDYATFDWLENTHEFVATHGVEGQFDEFARGFRNPWGLTVADVGGQTRILAVDNDPSFTPEKYDADEQNAGDELNEVLWHTQYGHPYVYGGSQPIVNFPDGSVPSGVAVAAGKVFVGLHNRSMVVKVDLAKRTWTPVIDGISPFSLFGAGNLLYVADFDGIHVIDASGL